MNRIQRKTLYKAAIRKWGLSLQMTMLMEEAAELIKAASKVNRKDNSEVWQNLAEEMADVEIMIEQFKYTVTWELLEQKVDVFKERKLNRLKEMLT